MRKRLNCVIVFVLAAVLLLLCGCGAEPAATELGTTEGPETVQPSKAPETPEPTAEITEEPMPTATPTPEPTPEPTPTPPPEPVSAVERMDRETLLTYDTEEIKGGWWFRRQTDHGIPTFGAALESICVKHNTLYLLDTTQPVMYLTFDLGFEAGVTGQILDVLKEYDIKATFFITKDYIKKQPALLQRMIDEGHNVGNHTTTHPDMGAVDVDQLMREFYELHDEMQEVFGYEVHYFRPPKGIISERVLAAADMMGYATVLWSSAYDDWGADKGYQHSYDMVVNNFHNGSVILMHASYPTTAAVLADVLDAAQEQGFSFAPLP